MKAWSAALADEVTQWPLVSTRSFFGFTALYRRERIFALLPRTRGMETANSLAFKVESPTPRLLAHMQRHPRIKATEMRKARWFTFEITADPDLRDALDCLGRAYEAAGKNKKPR
jgi:hypothetical protein